MYMTYKELVKFDTSLKNRTIFFVVTDEDAQMIAKDKFNRELTKDELYTVSKGVEWGFDSCWEDILKSAVENAIHNGGEVL